MNKRKGMKALLVLAAYYLWMLVMSYTVHKKAEAMKKDQTV